MENSLKQRIVGAVVLIALAVIFLPAILKEKTQQPPFQTQIPAKPVSLTKHKVSQQTLDNNQKIVAELDELEAQQVNKLQESRQNQIALDSTPEENLNDSQTDKNADTKAIEEKSEASTAKQSLVGEVQVNNPAPELTGAAWVIKVASFSNLDNANKLVEKLKSHGHKAYRRDDIAQKGKTIHRIYIGPFIKKIDAEKQLPNLDKLSESKGMLLSYDPLVH